MAILLTIIGKAWPYLLAAALAAFGTHYLDSIQLARLQSSFSSYRAQVAQQAAAADSAAVATLKAQLATAQATEARNGSILTALQADAAGARRDRDALAVRLRNAPASCPDGAGGGYVPEAASKRRATPAGDAGGQPTLAELCADVDAEDNANAARLNALIRELQPQL